MTYEPEHTPVDLKNLDDGRRVAITWADGETTTLDVDYLRSKCPCAGCVDEWTHEVKVRYEDVAGVTLKRMSQVGTYAFSIAFSDGHETGIFTYKRLRDLGEEA